MCRSHIILHKYKIFLTYLLGTNLVDKKLKTKDIFFLEQGKKESGAEYTPLEYYVYNFLFSPDELMKASKRGKTVMMFVRMYGVSGKEEADQLSSVWQVGLQNNHIQV